MSDHEHMAIISDDGDQKNVYKKILTHIFSTKSLTDVILLNFHCLQHDFLLLPDTYAIITTAGLNTQTVDTKYVMLH
jgi:hypothetical protein